jgi:Spy/CpxP family protein refolding chaperone
MRNKLLAIAAAAAFLAGTSVATVAQNSASDVSPGHKMQRKAKGSVGGPGASGYAPGHQMQTKNSKKGAPGASGYAPGHRSTIGSGKR